MFDKVLQILSDCVEKHRFHGTAATWDSQSYQKRCKAKVGKCYNDAGVERTKKERKRLF